ncbi:thymus-specific serine protease-like [Acanthaster planci]|uniref:Thymus-specific serine protease-like n=1 Tax=Acanthaster planci TaxID=133434 RepID=A0A8B7YXT9_ACAPL|nr:thymus-specific serine protease-like [Acanthaster planci]
MDTPTSLLLIFCCFSLQIAATTQTENDYSYVLQHYKRFWDDLDDEDIKRIGVKMRTPDFSKDFFTQPLDHFEVLTTETFPQPFYVVDQYWKKPNGPVFLYIGGEWNVRASEFTNGNMVDLAEKYGALILAVEHRFYRNFENAESMSLDQLNYLSSHQALADLAAFREFATKKFNLTERNLWISFGCSYSGMLSAWLRLKYPHLIHGAVSSSGPLRAVANFKEYNEIVTTAFGDPVAKGSEQCVSRIRAAFKTFRNKVDNEQYTELQQAFNSCRPLTNINDRRLLASTLQNPFMAAVQYNLPGYFNVEAVCNIMTNESYPDAFEALRAIYFKPTYWDQYQCQDFSYDGYTSYYRNTSRVTTGRPWLYQTCSQYGFYQTCDSDTNCMFTDLYDLNISLQFCKDVFGIDGPQVLGHVDWTNSFYGSDMPWGSRIVFANGDLDPWHALGVKNDLSDSMKSIMIRGGAHCQDIVPVTSYDSDALKAGRTAIENEVKKWLENPGLYQDPDCPSTGGVGHPFHLTLLVVGLLGGCLKH